MSLCQMYLLLGRLVMETKKTLGLKETPSSIRAAIPLTMTTKG